MTNQLGAHALVWSGTWDKSGARHAISSAAKTGFDLIEVPILDPFGIDTAMTRQLLDDYGLKAALSMGLPPHADVASEDKAVHAEGLRLLARAVEVAGEVGAEALCGVLYSRLAKYPAPLSERSRAHVVEALQHLAARGEEAGIPVNLEVVNRYETNVVNTAADMLRLLDDTGARNLGVHLDTYHMNIEEDDLCEALRASAGVLGCVHLSDSNRHQPGMGHVPFDAIFATLAAIDFDGVLSVECRLRGEPGEAVASAGRLLRGLLDGW